MLVDEVIKLNGFVQQQNKQLAWILRRDFLELVEYKEE